MPDLTGNPYMQGFAQTDEDRRARLFSTIANTLVGLGAGISQSGASGQPWFAGVGPGAAMGVSMNNAAQEQQWRQQMAAAQYYQQEAYRKAQEEHLQAQTGALKRNADLEEKMLPFALDALPGGVGGATGITAPSPPLMSPPTAIPPGVQMRMPLVSQTAEQTGVRPSLLAGVFSQESGGDPNAVSPAGASGFAQLMPGTARDLGVSNPKDPLQAIPAGGRYLAQNIQKYGGNEVLGLMAYNWGPGNVDNWLKNGADPSKVPAETRTYVQRVQGYDRLAQGGNGRVIPQGGDAPGQPGGSPAGGPQTFQPPVVGQVPPYAIPGNLPDPGAYSGLAISPRFAPLGAALRGSAEFKRKEALDLQKFNTEQQQKAEEQALKSRAATVDEANKGVYVDPQSGVASPNRAQLDAEIAKAAATAEAQQKAQLAYAGASTLTKAEMERYSKEVRPGAEATANGLTNLYEIKRLTEGPLASGSFIDARQTGARLLDTLGIQPMSDGMINRTEFTNRAGKNVLAFLQTRALGSGSGISEGDRRFVESLSGRGEFTTEELKRLNDVAIKSSHTALQQHDQGTSRLAKLPGVKEIADTGYFDIPTLSYADWQKANPAPDAAQTATPDKSQSMQPKSGDPLEGRTATGPNGQKVIRRNGQWVPQ